VGRAELGAESYGGQLRYNGVDAMGLGVQQLSNANALQVRRDVQTKIEELAKRFPPGLKYQVAFDTTRAVGESIREVLKTLAEAILIVIVVIFLFLQGWRSTVIPAITIPVSLVGRSSSPSSLAFHQHTDAVWNHACHRSCGRRCDRGD